MKIYLRLFIDKGVIMDELENFITKQSLLLGQISGHLFMINETADNDTVQKEIKKLKDFICKSVEELYYGD